MGARLEPEAEEVGVPVLGWVEPEPGFELAQGPEWE